MSDISEGGYEAIATLNEKISELTTDTGTISSRFVNCFSKVFLSDNENQFKSLIRDPNSKKLNDFLIKTNIPISLYSIWLTFRDQNGKFGLKIDLRELITK